MVDLERAKSKRLTRLCTLGSRGARCCAPSGCPGAVAAQTSSRKIHDRVPFSIAPSLLRPSLRIARLAGLQEVAGLRMSAVRGPTRRRAPDLLILDVDV